jgi:hypothetical protein
LQVNGEDVEHLRHKEAQDRILSAGNNFTLTVSRYVRRVHNGVQDRILVLETLLYLLLAGMLRMRRSTCRYMQYLVLETILYLLSAGMLHMCAVPKGHRTGNLVLKTTSYFLSRYFTHEQ